MTPISIKKYTENSNHTCVAAEAAHFMGRQLTYLTSFVLEQAVKVVRPLKPGFQDQGNTCFSEICYRILRLLLCLLLIWALPLGVIGGAIRALANLCSHDYTFIKPDDVVHSENKVGEISIRTFNAAMMPEFICVANGVRPTRDRIKELADTLLEKDDDIICLQEIFEIDATAYLSDKLKEKYPYIVCNVDPRIFGIGSGLMIASKYPIVKADFWKHADRGGMDMFANKGTLAVKIKPSVNQTLLVFTTHLNAEAGSNEQFPEGEKSYRESQLEQLKVQVDQFIDQSTADSPTIPTAILTGEYNIGPPRPTDDDTVKKSESERPDLEWKSLKVVMDPLIADGYKGTTSFDLQHDKKTGWDPKVVDSWDLIPECIDHIGIPNTTRTIQPVELLSRLIDRMNGTSDHLAVQARFSIE
jgi:exonuclease III